MGPASNFDGGNDRGATSEQNSVVLQEAISVRYKLDKSNVVPNTLSRLLESATTVDNGTGILEALYGHAISNTPCYFVTLLKVSSIYHVTLIKISNNFKIRLTTEYSKDS